MEIKSLTCIECPLGCSIEVSLNDDKIEQIRGYGCLRGKMYAENEVILPKRVITSTIRSVEGKMIPVKTDAPVPKNEIFNIMEKINQVTCKLPVKIGDVLKENIYEGVNLISTGRIEE